LLNNKAGYANDDLEVTDQYTGEVATRYAQVKGDPKIRETFIGPMISEQEASRLHGWIEAAAVAGDKILCGGTREGAMLDATLMENVPLDQDLCVEEA
jgi:acyl-CoA reductase-like NAD-dependent aldehyde dehydrogenase